MKYHVSSLFCVWFMVCSVYAVDRIVLTERQLNDLELLTTGAYAPLQGFLTRRDYESVLNSMRLADGTLWPIPIVLDVAVSLAQQLQVGQELFLTDAEGIILAALTVESIFEPNKQLEAQAVLGTNDVAHFGVRMRLLVEQMRNWYIGGKIRKIRDIKHYDFAEIRKTPEQVKAYCAQKGINTVIGFQTRNPIHRSHVATMERALQLVSGDGVKAHVLINPTVGVTQDEDVSPACRVRCYRALMDYLDSELYSLAVLPLNMRMAGPREALLHAIVRKNYGCTHFIVGRDHAGPTSAVPFYGPFDAINLVKAHENELGIHILGIPELMVHVFERDCHVPETQVLEGETVGRLSGRKLRELLMNGEHIPDWFSYPTVIEQLRQGYGAYVKRGATIFLTGIPASGKSTLAKQLKEAFEAQTNRPVIVLDGDLVRQSFAHKVGFTKEDRSAHVRNVGYIASLLTQAQAIVICALIAPYEYDRQVNRQLISRFGQYSEVFVSTPVGVCAERDPKGLYAQAMAGKLEHFVGLDGSYEEPKKPEFIVSSDDDESVRQFIDACVFSVLGSIHGS